MFEIKPILSTLARHKSSTLLIVLQIAITFSVVINSASIIKQRIDIMNRDSGLPESRLIALNINAFGSNYDIESNIRADIQMLRNTPGVVDAVSINQVPLSGSSELGMLASSIEGFENFETHTAGLFRGDSHMLNTLGVKLVAGRDFREDEVVYSSVQPKIESAIITQSLANKLFPDSNALGKQIYLGGDLQHTVVGIVEKMSGAWVHSPAVEDNMFLPVVNLNTFKRLLIRVENDTVAKQLLGGVEDLLIKRNSERVIFGVQSLLEHKDESYASDNAMTIILWVVIILLVIITALGIVGIVSFNVNQRVKQIGTRRALGARKIDILRYFITENILITILGLILGTVLTIGLNFYLVESFEMQSLNWLLLPAGMLSMLCIGVISVWVPAQRASNISPALATQSI